jgi:hypothetical protein
MMKCNCAEKTRRGNEKANYEHVKGCKLYDPEKELIDLMKKLIKGIEVWSGDEDGVHDQCWDAYSRSKWMVEGVIVSQERK